MNAAMDPAGQGAGTRSVPNQPEAPPHVRLVELSKKLGTLLAVDRVSLDIPRGQVTTLLGPSGCGKSTTLRILAGLYQLDSGDVILDGESIAHLPPNKRRMTMVFQEYALFPHLTVADNVGYGLRRRGMPAAQAKARIGEMLDLVGLSVAAGKHPHQLSGGQQQRVALARALAVDPEVLLLDEPLSNLDAKLRIRLREEIVRLQKVLGKTMVFVTHDQEEAMSISHQIAVMNGGRISQVGSPEEIYARPNSRYVAEFVGLANFIDARVVAPGRIEVGDISIPVPTQEISGRATLMVRPEAISIVDHAAPGDGPVLRGRLLQRTFLGSLARYNVETVHGVLIVDDDAFKARDLEGEVTLALSPDRLHLLPAA
ncbi:ABC transporter ATP-binding protein [Bosea sp. (in: a-proteobacteria)]|uniref:ABC transporter ATP-binding protein n=1 Tax=Bosea sp. (in: a-proteobacteria) TaxID=1871050 RepID=UPI00260BE69A|nr:ABC transporter ATP-binding protein [Bosea sp. (in: a-proteobacteria)]MCO5090742.1 ABC transporter ATP-binding protein [Bosea sp. (in: a-proteobacteria)]